MGCVAGELELVSFLRVLSFCFSSFHLLYVSMLTTLYLSFSLLLLVNSYAPNSQAPLPSTLPSFYTFLLTSPSLGLVVQLTNFIERGIQKAEPYLPTASSPVMKFPGAEGLEVKWLRTEKRPQEGCEVTDLEISSEGGKTKKVVKHLWFQGWPDKGVPSDVGLLMK